MMKTIPSGIIILWSWLSALIYNNMHSFSLGLPTYGRGWKTNNPSVHNTATGPSQKGKYTGEAGILSYYEVNCTHVNSPDILHTPNSFESQRCGMLAS